MKFARCCALVACMAMTAYGIDAEARATATPIGKVVKMLEDMVAKGVAEKQAEQVKFTAFWQWCGDQTEAKKSEIAAGTTLIDELSAKIEKYTVEIKELSDRVLELQEDVGRWKKDQNSATDVRTKESADYKATSMDYAESLTALDNAIATLKKQAYSRPQAELVQAALMQVQKLPTLSAGHKKALAAFLQQAQPDVDAMPAAELGVSAPEANAYEFQSGGVIDMLEKLKDQFSTKKYELDKEEMTAQHAFEQLIQQLTDEIENADHEISKKTKLSAETAQAKAEAEGDKARAIADRTEDEKYLADMTGMCAAKKTDFESRSELRQGEIDAIKKALDIISSGAVQGAGEKHLPSLLQKHGKKVALVQLRGANSGEMSPLQGRIAEFLAERAKSFNSRLLSLASKRVANDPFVKVKKMIKELVVKLMEEATAETEHKGWCDSELGTNKQKRERASAEVSKLTSEVEELQAEISQLGQDIEDLTAAVSELTAAMAKATEDRQESKATNEQTIEEAKTAQTAVEQAITVLKEFYAKSAEATALAQQSPAEDAPETFDKPYTGMMPEGGNVVDFLEVILTDFARLESETTSSEATEEDQHKKFMFESEKDKALKNNEISHKDEARTDRQTTLDNTQRELKMTQEELDDAIAYYEKLKPTCVDSGITYEARVKQRQQEIQSLQEALSILAGQDIDLS